MCVTIAVLGFREPNIRVFFAQVYIYSCVLVSIKAHHVPVSFPIGCFCMLYTFDF